jgi:hypothetical protein
VIKFRLLNSILNGLYKLVSQNANMGNFYGSTLNLDYIISLFNLILFNICGDDFCSYRDHPHVLPETTLIPEETFAKIAILRELIYFHVHPAPLILRVIT